MRIKIEDITNKATELEVVEEAETFEGFAELIASGEASFVSPVSSRVSLLRTGDMFEVEGTSSATLMLACGRCLAEFEVPVSVKYALTYVRELPKVDVEDGDEDEGESLTAEDMGLTLIEADEIDLADAIQEQVLMAMPMRPICSEDCKGLCQHCGIDLNKASCGCSAQVVNIKFAALKDFKVDKK